MNYIRAAYERGKVNELFISVHLFCIARDLVEQLKAEKQPIKYGKGQFYKSHLLKPEAIDAMYEEPDMPWLYGYAAYMQEFAELLEGADIAPFVKKH